MVSVFSILEFIVWPLIFSALQKCNLINQIKLFFGCFVKNAQNSIYVYMVINFGQLAIALCPPFIQIKWKSVFSWSVCVFGKAMEHFSHNSTGCFGLPFDVHKWNSFTKDFYPKKKKHFRGSVFICFVWIGSNNLYVPDSKRCQHCCECGLTGQPN